ncbi:YtxH domain-containing protein [Neobacillus fumarioli]|uniref:YtxH domain-containing protein n=1 Tax=Neobacillus fumarioli TaxID=105229 RepID=UPI0008306109|nr:YtxH domain-containing protein [Neobacillus fumarioli]
MPRDHEKQEITQSRTEEPTGNSFLLGAVIGGIVGGAVALLFAPKPGKELRRSISSQAGAILDKTEQIRENVRSKSNKLVSKTSSLSHGIVEQSSVLLNKVKTKTTVSSENNGEAESNYISIGVSGKSAPKKPAGKSKPGQEEIRKKLAETQKAFDEEENKVKL